MDLISASVMRRVVALGRAPSLVSGFLSLRSRRSTRRRSGLAPASSAARYPASLRSHSAILRAVSSSSSSAFSNEHVIARGRSSWWGFWSTKRSGGASGLSIHLASAFSSHSSLARVPLRSGAAALSPANSRHLAALLRLAGGKAGSACPMATSRSLARAGRRASIRSRKTVDADELCVGSAALLHAVTSALVAAKRVCRRRGWLAGSSSRPGSRVQWCWRARSLSWSSPCPSRRSLWRQGSGPARHEWAIAFVA